MASPRRAHPRSLQNLRPPFPKGQSGNPGGRPKKLPITEAYRQALTGVLPEADRRRFGLPKGATYADLVAVSMVTQARKGSVRAAQELGDRTEGKPAQRLEVSGPEGRAITFRVIYDEDEATA